MNYKLDRLREIKCFHFIYFFLQKYTNLLNLFLSVVQKDSSNEVKNLATTLLKYHVLASCKQLKIRPQDW